MKQKTVFCCSECGNETVKWSGRCLACGAWDSLVEVKADVRGKGSAKNAARSAAIKKPKLISELDTEAEMRLPWQCVLPPETSPSTDTVFHLLGGRKPDLLLR